MMINCGLAGRGLIRLTSELLPRGTEKKPLKFGVLAETRTCHLRNMRYKIQNLS